MNLFGGLPPAPWFAAEVRIQLNQPTINNKGDVQALKDFIFRQAARYGLAPSDLESDLKLLGCSSETRRNLIQTYSSQCGPLRKSLEEQAKYRAFIHPRVISSDIQGDSIRLNVQSSDSSVKQVTLDIGSQRQPLIDALEGALASFSNYEENNQEDDLL